MISQAPSVTLQLTKLKQGVKRFTRAADLASFAQNTIPVLQILRAGSKRPPKRAKRRRFWAGGRLELFGQPRLDKIDKLISSEIIKKADERLAF